MDLELFAVAQQACFFCFLFFLMAEWTCKGGTEKGVGGLQGYARFSFRSASTQDTYRVLKDSGELACDDWQPRLCGWLLNGESGVCGKNSSDRFC